MGDKEEKKKGKGPVVMKEEQKPKEDFAAAASDFEPSFEGGEFAEPEEAAFVEETLSEAKNSKLDEMLFVRTSKSLVENIDPKLVGTLSEETQTAFSEGSKKLREGKEVKTTAVQTLVLIQQGNLVQAREVGGEGLVADLTKPEVQNALLDRQAETGGIIIAQHLRENKDQEAYYVMQKYGKGEREAMVLDSIKTELGDDWLKYSQKVLQMAMLAGFSREVTASLALSIDNTTNMSRSLTSNTAINDMALRDVLLTRMNDLVGFLKKNGKKEEEKAASAALKDMKRILPKNEAEMKKLKKKERDKKRKELDEILKRVVEKGNSLVQNLLDHDGFDRLRDRFKKT